MKQTELLLFIILVYFTVTSHNVFGKKKNKNKSKKPSSTTYETSMNKSIEYYIENTSIEEAITSAVEKVKNVSCLNFSRINNNLNLNATMFKYHSLCHARAEIANKHIVYSVNLNHDCNDESRISKLIFWSAKMRYQINKCIEGKPQYQQGQIDIQDDKIETLIKETKCQISKPFEANSTLQPYFLQFFSSVPEGKEGIEYDHFEHKDYSKDISFSAIKDLNEKICSDSCKNYPCTKCFNQGIRYPKLCPQCICPFFFEGKYCKDYKKSKDKCGSAVIIAGSYAKKITLDLKSECYYRIKPKFNHRRIVVRFTPKEHFNYNCKLPKLLEARHFKDKSMVGVIPCGNLKSFAVKSKKGKDVLVYHRKLNDSLLITMEYKLVVC